MKMNQQNLVAKLNQIVEQAQLTLQDPRSLTTERQRMIIALARFVSAEMSQPSPTQPDA
jgi:predicted outer membrane protein